MDVGPIDQEANVQEVVYENRSPLPSENQEILPEIYNPVNHITDLQLQNQPREQAAEEYYERMVEEDNKEGGSEGVGHELHDHLSPNYGFPALRELLNKMSVAYGEEKEELICCVCLVKIDTSENMVELNCDTLRSHKFHQECIFNWLKRKRSCPLCRKDFVKTLKLKIFSQSLLSEKDQESELSSCTDQSV